MSDLPYFREKVTIYRKRQDDPETGRPYTQEKLAEAIGLSADELGRRLRGTGRIKISKEYMLAIVCTLAAWETLSREEAVDLLSSMDYPLDTPHWKTKLQPYFSSPVGSLESTLFIHSDNQRREERLVRLRAIVIDHRGFLYNRLESFVGRQIELAEIRDCISTMLPTGGYLTLTGQAGQGKSSTVAKLVHEYGLQQTAHHFIPFNPGPDYQVNLLRDLMARLILKHDLPDLYVANESRPVLRDFFSKVLVELAGKEKQEVIFIDGLDQLKADSGNERDLSFLPPHLPPGVVIVLGTRPDDTLYDLKLSIPPREYHLPNLSRQDFDLLLKHRNVHIDKQLVDRFYRAMQENALYLDLTAKELAQEEIVDPEQIIQRVADNPANIFSLSIDRLKRRESQWDKVIYPILGLLLAALEPLMLQHIKQILFIEDYRLKDGLERLRGLIVEDRQQRYSLFHVKLYEYLRQDEAQLDKEYVFAKQEEGQWHKKLAMWCEQGDLSTIWTDIPRNSSEQGRRMYARNHYVAHLYMAQEWDRLFEVLDTGHYGRAKLKQHFSMRPYSQDLKQGQQAAVFRGGEIPDFLSYLWRYTLLRCSLNSRADQYPSEAFSALVVMKRVKEAIDLAELLTEPEKRGQALLQIAFSLKDQPEWEHEYSQLLDNVYRMIPTLEENEEKASVLHGLCAIFTEIQLWDKAEAVACMAKDDEKKSGMLRQVGIALIEVRLWKRAEAIASTIITNRARASVLQRLGTALAKDHQRERAESLWAQAESVIHSIEDDHDRELAQQSLCVELIKAHQWERASAIAEIIEHRVARDWVWRNLCAELAQKRKYEQAEAIAKIIEYDREKAMAFLMLGIALAQADYQERAEEMWNKAVRIARTKEEGRARGWILYELGIALSEAHQETQAEAIWDEAETVIQNLGDTRIKIVVLQELGMALIKAQNLRRAGAALTEAARLACRTDEHRLDAWALQHLCTFLAQAQQWEQAETTAQTIEDSRAKAWALRDLCEELALAQQWERAEAIAQTIKENAERAKALLMLCAELAFAQQWERAEAIWAKVPPINRVLKEESEVKVSALQNLGVVLAKLQQYAQSEVVMAEAETTINAIGDAKTKSWLLRDFCISLAQAHQWERAKAIVPKIDDDIARAWALSGMCSVLAQTGQYKSAEWLVDEIDSDGTNATALQQLGVLFAHAQQWERAESLLAKARMLAQKIEGSQAKAWALQRQGWALIAAQKQDQAEAVLIEAEEVARTIVEIDTRGGVLQEISWTLALADQWERSEAIASTIEDNNVKVNILSRLGIALVQTQQLEHAKAIAQKIDQSRAKVGILQSLAIAFIKAKQWDQVGILLTECENLVDTIGELEYRAFAQLKLGIAFAQAHQREQAERMWTDAEATAEKIVLAETKTRLLVEFCTLYAQNQEWSRAQIIANSIAQSHEKADALLALGTELVRAQRWTQAEAVLSKVEILVHSLKNNKNKEILLNKILDVLEMAGKHERKLRLVQHALQQATTRIYAIQILSLVTRLLPLKPELGMVYCEAFTWVETFLGEMNVF